MLLPTSGKHGENVVVSKHLICVVINVKGWILRDDLTMYEWRAGRDAQIRQFKMTDHNNGSGNECFITNSHFNTIMIS